MNEDEYCVRCKFFRHEHKDTGECHRHSPQIGTVEEIGMETFKPQAECDSGGTFMSPNSTVWPGVSVRDWCGDFQVVELSSLSRRQEHKTRSVE